ncbi:hypothetical protein D7W82_17205 [Corallococcus sp. CA049B]|nr:hypothetical protein D7W82_17205 [Corallococcus sp. CA049B]
MGLMLAVRWWRGTPLGRRSSEGGRGSRAPAGAGSEETREYLAGGRVEDGVEVGGVLRLPDVHEDSVGAVRPGQLHEKGGREHLP